MTLVIDLTPEEEARLRGMAARRGQTVEQYALELIRRALDEECRQATTTHEGL